MPRHRNPPPPKKASGANIEEWQRSGGKVQFRLRDQEYAWLEHLARQAGESTNVHALRLLRGVLGYDHPPPRDEETEEEARANWAADQRGKAWREERD